MKRKIRKVAVLGAGVMGTGIAAHLANVGIPCVMLDIVPPFLSDEEKKDRKKRSMFAEEGLKKALKNKPALFYSNDGAALVETGNLEDDLHKVADCDWIVEVVKEDLAVKRTLFHNLLKYRKEGTIVTSNTSGLSIAKMTEGFPEEFCRHFLVTHFFNPVRYLKLLELVVGEKTDPEVVKLLADFGENVLGKGIVYGKDTPNFVANRIGIHAVMTCLEVMRDLDLSVEAVDLIAGPPMGRPKSAVFRTMDLVGLDTFASVARNVFDNAPNDEERSVFQIPAFIKAMVDKKLLGDKTRGGFYKKEKSPDGKKTKFALNLKTIEYAAAARPSFNSVDSIKGDPDVRSKVGKLVYLDDVAARFAWKVTARNLIYAANRLFEIADDVVNIDRGMRWGFNWDLGPFEMWDAIGLKKSIERMEAEGMKVPALVKKVLTLGEGTFYKKVDGVEHYFDFRTDKYLPVPKRDSWLVLEGFKARNKIVQKNDSASLIDLGDNCLGLEFHSRMNAIDDDVIATMYRGLELLDEGWDGMVLYNEGQHFSVGANLVLINMYAMQKKWKEIESIVDKFQRVNTLMHRADKPVVAAPHQMALGGGCEVCLGASHIVAHAELYMGLVEVGVGLIPGGGGTKEMLVRWFSQIPKEMPDASVLPYFQKVFEIVGTAKVSFSAKLAENMLFLRPGIDKIVTSRDNQLHTAKMYALGLSKAGYTPQQPMMLKVPGRDGIALAEVGLYTFGLGGYATPYDVVLGKRLAYVLAGGDVNPGTLVSEDRILELEKETFMSLLGDQRTMDRIKHMLLHSKPLRN